jgi:hypothetical protein
LYVAVWILPLILLAAAIAHGRFRGLTLRASELFQGRWRVALIGGVLVIVRVGLNLLGLYRWGMDAGHVPAGDRLNVLLQSSMAATLLPLALLALIIWFLPSYKQEDCRAPA